MILVLAGFICCVCNRFLLPGGQEINKTGNVRLNVNNEARSRNRRRRGKAICITYYEKLKYLFIKIRIVGSRVVPCGRTDGHDEANSRFSQFCERAKKCCVCP